MRIPSPGPAAALPPPHPPPAPARAPLPSPSAAVARSHRRRTEPGRAAAVPAPRPSPAGGSEREACRRPPPGRAPQESVKDAGRCREGGSGPWTSSRRTKAASYRFRPASRLPASPGYLSPSLALSLPSLRVSVIAGAFPPGKGEQAAAPPGHGALGAERRPRVAWRRNGPRRPGSLLSQPCPRPSSAGSPFRYPDLWELCPHFSFLQCFFSTRNRELENLGFP